MGRMRVTSETLKTTLRSGGRAAVSGVLRTTQGKNALRQVQGEPAVIRNVRKATGKTPRDYLN